jgi:hypothetical protein
VSDLQPIRDNQKPTNSQIGRELLNRLSEALHAFDYGQIQMIAAYPRHNLDQETQKSLAQGLATVADVVGTFVVDSLPKTGRLRASGTLSIADAVSSIEALYAVANELSRVEEAGIVPSDKMIVLKTRVQNCANSLIRVIVARGEQLKQEFEGLGRDILERLREAMQASPRDIETLKSLSRRVTEVFEQSCLIEDAVPGWRLGSNRRGYLRIAAKELTNHAGVPTEVPVREDIKRKKPH